MQTTLVYVILAVAAAYALWWMVQTARKASDPYCGCQGCQQKAQKLHVKHKKEDCRLKK